MRIDDGISLSDDKFLLLVSREIVNFFEDLTIIHFAIWRLDKSEFIDTRERTQRGDQTDVGTFRGLNRADTSIMAGVYVTNFKAGAIAAQTPGPEGAETTLMRQLRE